MALYVLSLGGSIVVPGAIDTAYLIQFKEFIHQRIAQGDRFILTVGGGKTARNYQTAAEYVSGVDDEERDWLGIHATRLNAHLLRTIFKEQAHPIIAKDFDISLPDFAEPILVGAGWKPGWSTDYIAVLLAQRYQAKTVLNLSNIDYVYSEDPRENPDAQRFEQINWADFRKIVGSEWTPGLSAPFDPIASKKAEELALTVVILNGKKIDNMKAFLSGDHFQGTVIQST
ncbi:UMP kinase [Tunicatimonas pelagia]|uniref:UMP kinase n=1 Tax=Tunicatimonas pelagia TaxID=931531 RepID=UPI002664FB47|nr:UMP kinase [Tunicatimonas pelagia]WKN44053.1 UMP kinase [Tunicatimonas pelagia]